MEHFFFEEKGFKGTDDEKKQLTEAVFAWCVAWGLGASLTQNGKDKFDMCIKDQFKAAKIPSTFTIFDHYYDLKKEKTYKAWTVIMKPFEYDKEMSFFDLIVPT